MVDIFTKEKRSEIMSKIRSRDTKIELSMRPHLEEMGFEYQPKMRGKPDFAHRQKKIVVFLDGCFWHGCPEHLLETGSWLNLSDWWRRKITRNISRDRKVTKELTEMGFKVLRFWEHEVEKDIEKLIRKIRRMS